MEIPSNPAPPIPVLQDWDYGNSLVVCGSDLLFRGKDVGLGTRLTSTDDSSTTPTHV